jgi:hypothetical protein
MANNKVGRWEGTFEILVLMLNSVTENTQKKWQKKNFLTALHKHKIERERGCHLPSVEMYK